MKELKTNLENAVNAIIKAFEEKHDVNFQFFVADDCIGIASFGETYYFNISDILYDISTDQPKGLIFEWHEGSLENKNNPLNYQSYCKGARFEGFKRVENANLSQISDRLDSIIKEVGNLKEFLEEKNER